MLWFRNDLRVHDNPAVDYALNQGVKQAIYLATPKQWQLHNQAEIKTDFILRHVQLLSEQLLALGICLKVVDVDDFKGQIDYLSKHAIATNTKVIANYEIELNERNRDEKLIQLGCDLSLFCADVIVPHGKVSNLSGEMYKVFTPFKKAWLNYVRDNGFNYIYRYPATETENPNSEQFNTCSQQLDQITKRLNTKSSNQWPLIDTIEANVIGTFLSDKMSDYHLHRDIPGIKGTSGLSPYLAIGALSPRYLLMLIMQRFPDILISNDSPQFTWLNELIWREFYRHLLWHFPKLAKGENFREKYNNLPWPNNHKLLQAWQQGRTGYPIVDAAMRQLNTTGWMHNRLRMIVASFLTKHLLIDWRLGEKYFSEQLIDSDLAANNGGWQWSAGTGCDAQPYFRVFNPISQSKKFDPDAEFIRKYLPELRQVPLKHIHFPHQYLAENNLGYYWPAVVEHKSARLAALEFYKANS
ncbi:cryptochrome/photolyase family protein [Thalassomonas sp. M1454]|uniref:cryptochrome/photolyase family protein n=1 Tax=Thalassomonas sp. M1454 TaxID=2594477 RepID=UPI00117C3D09|nr:FAD-binding domain-containing protein [Thalassomonas sp. M1454]TRX54995.1 deoxyribodipyrimidine photo-lyase [Thalassomonas sp. M1454]